MMNIKNKLFIAMLSFSFVLPAQYTFANAHDEAVAAAMAAAAAADAAASTEEVVQISQTPEQKQDGEKLRAVLLLVDMDKMNALAELGDETDVKTEDQVRKAALNNMKVVNQQAKKLKMQSIEGKDALSKFIKFNDYNIQYLENDYLFKSTDAEKEKISATIVSLNEDVMKALSLFFVE